MSAASVRQMTDRIAALAEKRMGLRRSGDTPRDLRRAAGYLPRKVGAAMETLATAHEQAADPVSYALIDQERLAAAYDLSMSHIDSMDPGFRRRQYLRELSGSLWVNLSLLVLLLGLVWYFFLR